jgi:hypothetical protein
MDSDLKAGEVVILKSGGQKFTVVRIFEEEGIEFADVVWSLPSGSAKYGRGTFPTAALQRVEDPKDGEIL